jgi:Na+-driven multidrug efflux pump
MKYFEKAEETFLIKKKKHLKTHLRKEERWRFQLMRKIVKFRSKKGMLNLCVSSSGALFILHLLQHAEVALWFRFDRSLRLT